MLIALTTTILAAKMNESVVPSFEYTASLLPGVLLQKVSKAQWKSLEYEILALLDFELKFDSPVLFLNRFIHVLGLEAIDTADPVRDWASNLSLHFQREAEYLKFRPSQVAAACLMFAINIVDQGAEVSGQKPVTPEIAASLEMRGLKSP